MMKVYKCDDYMLIDGILIIFNGVNVSEVDSIETFNKITQILNYDSIVCPELYCDEHGNKVKGIIFK